MKILMLSADFLPNIGGIASHVYELSKALQKQGHKVWVITDRSRFGGKRYEEIDGIKIYRTHFRRVKLIGTILYYLAIWFRMARLIKEEGIDILHIHSLDPDAVSGRFVRNIPKVETEHSSRFLRDMETGKSLVLNKWLMNSADFVIGTSQELVEAVIKLGINKDKTRFISNGVDAGRFHPGVGGVGIKDKYGVKPGEPVILCSRRLEPKNGVGYLIESIPRVIEASPDARFLVVGDGNEGEKLRQRVSELKISNEVIFTGRVANSEMPAYYAISDIVVLPSLMEATSIAGLEAMATGKPLVATNIGGIPQIVDDGKTGILVPAGDSEKLAQGMISLLKDDTKRRTMGIAARKKVEADFSWDIIAQETLGLYNEVIELRGKGTLQGGTFTSHH